MIFQIIARIGFITLFILAIYNVYKFFKALIKDL